MAIVRPVPRAIRQIERASGGYQTNGRHRSGRFIASLPRCFTASVPHPYAPTPLIPHDPKTPGPQDRDYKTTPFTFTSNTGCLLLVVLILTSPLNLPFFMPGFRVSSTL